jgi:hypothetical protein
MLRVPFSFTKQICCATFLLGVLLSSILLCTSLSFAQGPDTLWTRTFGGNRTDLAFDIQLTSDGGYIIAGYSSSFSSGGAYLIKLNSAGESLWARDYRYTGIYRANSVVQTVDGGYIFTGNTLVNPVLVKTDSIGNVTWIREYDGIYGDPWEGRAVLQTLDGGYVFTADGGVGNSPDISLVKTNSAGDTLWTRQFGGERWDKAPALQLTEDGGYVFAGSTYPYPYDITLLDFYLVKTNANGDSVWTQTYGGEDYERGNAMDQTSDGGYVIAGGIERLDWTNDMYVVKTDALGDTMWTRTYGGLETESAYGIEQTEDGGYVIFGHTLSYGAGGADFYLLKIDSLGDTLWTRTYGGSDTEFGLSFQQTPDGGYVMAGWTLSFGAGGWDIYVVKTGPEIAAASDPHLLPESITLHQNYPNPFNASTRITFDLPKVGLVTLKVYDVLGREVTTLMDDVRAPGYHSVLFDGSNLSSGIYFYRLEIGGIHEVKKMMLLK